MAKDSRIHRHRLTQASLMTIFAALLCMALLFGNASPVSAATATREPISGIAVGDTVILGELPVGENANIYNGIPRWKVIKVDEAKKQALVISEYLWTGGNKNCIDENGNIYFNSSLSKGNDWNTSDAATWCKTLYTDVLKESAERRNQKLVDLNHTITVGTTSDETPSITGQGLFFISWMEGRDAFGDQSNGTQHAKNADKMKGYLWDNVKAEPGKAGEWWLRTQDSWEWDDGTVSPCARYVKETGEYVGYASSAKSYISKFVSEVNDAKPARPAFYLNLNETLNAPKQISSGSTIWDLNKFGKTADPKVSIDDWTYGENPKDVVIEESYKTRNKTIRYKKDKAGAEYSNTVPTEAGDYVVAVSINVVNKDYITVEESFSIEQREASIVWDETSLTYNGTNQAPAATVDNLLEGDSCNVEVTGQQTNAGAYTAVASGLDNPNYKLPEKDAQLQKTYTIGKKELTASVIDPDAITYGDDAPAYFAAYNGWAKDDDTSKLTATPKFVCTYSKGDDAGEYVITIDEDTQNDINYYFKPEATGTLTVSPRPITVKAKDKTSVAGEDIAPLDYEITNGSLAEGDAMEKLGITLTTTATKASPAGTYPIKLAEWTNHNYDVTCEDGEYTITAATPEDNGDQGSQTEPVNPSSGGNNSPGEKENDSSGRDNDPSGGQPGGTTDSQVEADQKAADAVNETLTALPEKIDLSQEDAVAAARSAYEDLTDAQKALVPVATLEKLTQAEQIITDWKAYTADVATAEQITTAVAKVKNTKGKKATVTWKKATGNTGYQIHYSVNKKFKKNVKTKTIKKAGTNKITLKKLKKGKTYYVQVRTYTTVTNRATGETSKVYGDWSKTKKVKVKK